MNNIPDDFDWKTYLNLNPDLVKYGKINNRVDSILHYIDHGIKEKRIYKVSIPNDFNWENYVSLNLDLQNKLKNREDAEIHWTKFGSKEGRSYKTDKLSHFGIYSRVALSDPFINKISSNKGNYLDIKGAKKVLIIIHVGNKRIDIAKLLIDIAELNNIFYKRINPKCHIQLEITISDYVFFQKHEIENYLKTKTISWNICKTKNQGADLRPFIETLLRIGNLNFDYILKLHTKTIPVWSMEVLRPFASDDGLFTVLKKFESDVDISIIGDSKWNIPIFLGLATEYKKQIAKFAENFDINIKFIETDKIVRKSNALIKNKKIDLFKYINSHDDFHSNENCYEKKFLKKHAQEVMNSKTLFRNGLFDNEISENPELINFIGGTIYMVRGEFIKYFIESNRKVLLKFMDSFEYGYVKDGDGTKFTLTHAFERLLGLVSYGLGMKVYGIDLKTNPIMSLKSSLSSVDLTENTCSIILFIDSLNNHCISHLISLSLKLKKNGYSLFLVVDQETKNIKSNLYDLFERIYFIRKKGLFNASINYHATFKLINILHEINPILSYSFSFKYHYYFVGLLTKNIPSILILKNQYELIEDIMDNNFISYDYANLIDKVYVESNMIANILKNNFNKINNIEHNLNLENMSIEKESFSIEDQRKKMCNYDKIIGLNCKLNNQLSFKIKEFIKKNSNILFINISEKEEVYFKNLQYIDDYESAFSIIEYFLYFDGLNNGMVNLKNLFLIDKDFLILINNEEDKKIFESYGLSYIHHINELSLDLIRHSHPTSNSHIVNNFEINDVNLIKENIRFKLDKKYSFFNKDILNLNPKRLFSWKELYKIDDLIVTQPTNYRIIEYYALKNEEVLLKYSGNYDEISKNIYSSNCSEEIKIDYFPNLNLPKLVMVIHESTMTGAPIVACEIANYLQKYFDVIMISKDEGFILDKYSWRNRPIQMKKREYEHGRTRYLDRYELAYELIEKINPQVLFVTSFACHEFVEVGQALNIFTLYHAHEGRMGFNSLIMTHQIPFEGSFKNLKKINYYSASPETTYCFTEKGIINNEYKVDEFQVINFDKVILKSNELCDVNIKNEDRKLIGMVGTCCLRKGTDLFLQLAKDNSDIDFVWIGSSGEMPNIFDDPPENLKYLGRQMNPYIYMKQFDFMILSSREDLFPLVGIESMILGVNVGMYKENIGAFKKFEEMGAIVASNKTSNNNLQFLLNEMLNSKNKIDYKKLNEYNLKRICDEKIYQDIMKHINSITPNKFNLFWDNKYGWNSYNVEAIYKKLKDFYANGDNFDLNVYKNKYKDLSEYLSDEELEKHYYKTGKIAGRNCINFDWKLIVSINEDLWNMKPYNVEKLFENLNSQLESKNIKTRIEFDLNKYRNKYADLKNLSNEDLLSHWKQYGIWEGRCCEPI